MTVLPPAALRTNAISNNGLNPGPRGNFAAPFQVGNKKSIFASNFHQQKRVKDKRVPPHSKFRQIPRTAHRSSHNLSEAAESVFIKVFTDS